MATNLNAFNFDLFKIGQTQQTGSTTSVEKTSKSSKDIDIAAAAGWNNFKEDFSGDTFVRTSNKESNEAKDVAGVDKANKATQTNPAAKAKNAKVAANGAQDKVDYTGGAAEGKGFGMLSTQNQEKSNKLGFSGFGSLSMGDTPQYTSSNESEIQELANELGCEAKESVVKDKLQEMSAKDLAKLDSKYLDMAEDLDLLSMKDVEQKTGVKEKDLASNNIDKKADKKIKFGTMTSGDMV